jgi:4'-phosphopantetheinyl transferase
VLPRWRSVGFPPASGEVGQPSPDVHVWLLNLDPPTWLMRLLRETLDAEEQARASAFVFPADRTRYTAAHGLVRHVLAGYLGASAADVAYQYDRHGKPHLVVGGVRAALRFNLSHSANRCLCAVALDRDVGVDIEQIRADRDHPAISESYFSPAERAGIRALPTEQRLHAFYDCWTRKEAYLKATGDGLSVSLDSFDVPVGPDPITAPAGSAAGRHAPRLSALPAVPGFAAALAVLGEGWNVAAFSLDPDELSGPLQNISEIHHSVGPEGGCPGSRGS